MKNVTLLASLLIFAGCYQKHLILQAEAVSMMRTDAESLSKLTPGSEVKEKWCMGDEPAYQDGSEEYGFADQVIYKAQKKGQAADFIANARIWRDSDGCALLEGQLVKM